MEKNLTKNVCVHSNHFTVHLKLTQQCKLTILQLKNVKKNYTKRGKPDFQKIDKESEQTSHQKNIQMANKHRKHCWRECKMAQPLWKTVWSFLTK